jgi:putative transcriptional regulator
MTDATYLTGHLLIAMPAMQDPNFVKTVTYICEHSDQGALGIVINRPLDMDLGTIFDQLSLGSADPELARQPVVQGGPVHQERGFVLHEPAEASDREFDATLAVTDAIRVTTSQDILTAMARGQGPRRADSRQRCSKGVSKMILGDAGTLSQAFCTSSLSSCPAPQPA